MTRNICLTLAYDGTNYVGWQVQPNGVSVQSVVERAIKKLTGETQRVIAAGRTDSGVHALGQAANFHTECNIPCEKIQRGLQNFLPDDVIVRDAAEVDADFHATYSAKSKHYRYVIHNSRIRIPFLRNYAWNYAAPLDADAMQAGAERLLGTYDFRCFESQYPNKATSVRTITESRVTRTCRWEAWGGSLAISQLEDFLVFDVRADGFLYNMVRAIVGTLVRVGRGHWTPQDVTRIIAEQDRSQAGETAPACGLYLVAVEY